MKAPASAVVFAYHNVGLRCLQVLFDAGVDVRLVVTHADNSGEAIWFGSVAALAAEHRLPCIAPVDANEDEVLSLARSAAPDFLFSFYYRQMLGAPLLAIPRRGAFNMHGSLLPKYRGRAPVNWAILRGERETGATLHSMEVKPDAGPIVNQCAVPILRDDNAREVFDKVTLAAEIVLARSLPHLMDGTARLTPQGHAPGQYFGRRQPEDGRIPCAARARQIHDLVRAVPPPEYPGAFFDVAGRRIVVARTLRCDAPGEPCAPLERFAMRVRGDDLRIDAVDGGSLRVVSATVDGDPLNVLTFRTLFGPAGVSPEGPA